MRYYNSNSIFGLLVVLSTCSCGTSFKESHYFTSATSQADFERPRNFFRVNVDGWAAFSAARYVSGYYDERAVDLFFNEVKTVDAQEGVIIRPLFPGEVPEPFTGDKIRPLSPAEGKGALVMILSTNADAVADAIGNFAEGQAAAAAISNLVNRDEIRAARRTQAEQEALAQGANALAAEVETLLASINPQQEAAFRRDYLRVAQALGRSLDPPVAFADLSDLAKWHSGRLP